MLLLHPLPAVCSFTAFALAFLPPAALHTTHCFLLAPPQIPAAMAAVFLLNGQGTAGLVFGGLALLTAWVFSLWREQIQLATRLLGVSAHGLAANSGIITTTVLLNLAALLAVLPLGAFLGGLGEVPCAAGLGMGWVRPVASLL